MYKGESHIPDASSVEEWKDSKDYMGGFWMLVAIDRARVNTKPVRVNISLPESLLHDIDAFADSHHMTRSGIFGAGGAEGNESIARPSR